MPTFEELDALDAKTLHDRAFHRAERRLDVGFFYRLLEEIPAAQAAAGDAAEGVNDIGHVTALVRDLFAADEGPLAEALRPVYIEYLLAQGD